MVKCISYKTPEEQLRSKYEIMGKTLLEIVYLVKEEKLTNQEREELINCPDWKSRNKFWLTKQGWINYYLPKRRQITSQQLVKSLQGTIIRNKELEEHNEWLQRELKEAWSAEDTHIEVMRDISELAKKQNDKETEHLRDKVESKSKEAEDNYRLLQEANKKIERSERRVGELEKDLEGKNDLSKQLEQLSDKSKRQEIQIKKLERELEVANKSLSKSPSNFKVFKEKAKTAFQKLIRKEKQQKQALVARIEVKAK